ncbi:MAG: hypothetical protein ACRYF5_18680 [Janthinobacterium lividum]
MIHYIKERNTSNVGQRLNAAWRALWSNRRHVQSPAMVSPGKIEAAAHRRKQFLDSVLTWAAATIVVVIFSAIIIQDNDLVEEPIAITQAAPAQSGAL